MFLQHTGPYINVWSQAVSLLRWWQSVSLCSLFWIKDLVSKCVLTYNFETARSEVLTAAFPKIGRCCTVNWQIFWGSLKGSGVH
jgi:hypothetical protein